MCASGLPVACYCETECPSGTRMDMGVIAGPCGADEPVIPVVEDPARVRETAPPAPEE